MFPAHSDPLSGKRAWVARSPGCLFVLCVSGKRIREGKTAVNSSPQLLHFIFAFEKYLLNVISF